MINREDKSGQRRVRIHAIGFPVRPDAPQYTSVRFATLMRILCGRNGGTFVGSTSHEANPRVHGHGADAARGMHDHAFRAQARSPSAAGRADPAVVGIYMSPEFRSAVHSEERDGAKYEVVLGKAQSEGFERLMNAMFTRTVPVTATDAGGRTDPQIRGVLEPILEDYSFVTPRDAGARIFAVSVKYRINGYDPPARCSSPGPSPATGASPRPRCRDRAPSRCRRRPRSRCAMPARSSRQSSRTPRLRAVSSPPAARHRPQKCRRCATSAAAPQAPPACPGPLVDSGAVAGMGSKYVWANFTSAVSSGLPSLRRGRCRAVPAASRAASAMRGAAVVRHHLGVADAAFGGDRQLDLHRVRQHLFGRPPLVAIPFRGPDVVQQHRSREQRVRERRIPGLDLARRVPRRKIVRQRLFMLQPRLIPVTELRAHIGDAGG